MRVSLPIKADSGARLGLGLLLLGLGLAGCTAPPVRSADFPNFGEVTASFVEGQDIQAITVRSLDRLPLTAATLVLPDGARVEADSIDQQRNPTLENRMALGGLQGDVAAIGGGVPRLTGPGQPEASTFFVGQIASIGLIHVPDLVAYKGLWPQAKVELRLGRAPDERIETLPAPKPL